MNLEHLIEKLMAAEVLTTGLVEFPSGSASESEIANAENRLGLKIDAELKEFWSVWNGADLDVIRIYGTARVENEDGNILFSSDPSGFMYFLIEEGGVMSLDTDGGEEIKVAESFNEFLYSYVFGRKSHEFGGEEWKRELQSAGVAI